MRVELRNCTILKSERSKNVFGPFKYRPQWKPYIFNINLNGIKTKEEFLELFKALTDDTGTFRISGRNWRGRFVGLGTFVIGKNTVSIPNNRCRLAHLLKRK